jgi:ankyrin repeat protein
MSHLSGCAFACSRDKRLLTLLRHNKGKPLTEDTMTPEQATKQLFDVAMRDYTADAVPALLAAGADLNAKGEKGNTPLHVVAIYDRRMDTARLLIEHGADLNARNEFGQTPLLAAAENASAKAVQLLLQNGADRDARDEDGRTALEIARARNNRIAFQEIQAILEAATEGHSSRVTKGREGAGDKEAGRNQ